MVLGSNLYPWQSVDSCAFTLHPTIIAHCIQNIKKQWLTPGIWLILAIEKVTPRNFTDPFCLFHPTSWEYHLFALPPPRDFTSIWAEYWNLDNKKLPYWQDSFNDLTWLDAHRGEHDQARGQVLSFGFFLSLFPDCSGKKLQKKRNSFSIFSESMKRLNFQKLTKFLNYTDAINWTILCMLEYMKN